MRTITLAPAGKQPVRIATMMAFGSDINVVSKKDQFAGVSKKVKSIIRHISASVTVQGALLCSAGASAVSAWIAAAVYSAAESRSAALAVAVSAAACAVSLAAVLRKRGGEL